MYCSTATFNSNTGTVDHRHLLTASPAPLDISAQPLNQQRAWRATPLTTRQHTAHPHARLAVMVRIALRALLLVFCAPLVAAALLEAVTLVCVKHTSTRLKCMDCVCLQGNTWRLQIEHYRSRVNSPNATDCEFHIPWPYVKETGLKGIASWHNRRERRQYGIESIDTL